MTRRLVFCADGTWNEPDQQDAGLPSPTNVAKIAAAVLPTDADGTPQIVYYHKGVGERGGLWDHLTGGAFGVGLDRNIEDLYLFLVNNYAPGDQLFLFGFSRGAYTVRAFAGLIRNSGILKRENVAAYDEAFALYRDRSDATKPGAPRCVEFRSRFSWQPDCRIRFIGVWDTVGALGIPVTPLRFWNKKNYEFHDLDLSRSVDHAHQALAIDERRKPFVPSLWRRQPDAPASQVVEQAWFPGVHCNVGGGYADAGLSDGALLWIWDRAEGCGLALDPARRPRPDASGAIRDSMTFFYRVLGDRARELKDQTGLHHSALDRRRLVPAYRPRNLEAFMARQPNGQEYRP